MKKAALALVMGVFVFLSSCSVFDQILPDLVAAEIVDSGHFKIANNSSVSTLMEFSIEFVDEQGNYLDGREFYCSIPAQDASVFEYTIPGSANGIAVKSYSLAWDM